MMKTRILSIVALLLMAVTGAWAQTEGLLTSITTNHSKTITYSTAGCATLTTSGKVDVSEVENEIYGWTNSSSYNGSLTVTPSEGYTITKVVFKGYDKDDGGWFEAFTDTEAPYTCYMKSSEVSLSETMDAPGTDTYKICQIDVYGYSNPTVTANVGATGEYWATYYNGTTSFTADENTTVFQAALSGSSLTLTEVPNREIPAGKAVILKSSSATITLTPASTTETLEGNSLTGTTAAMTGAAGNIYVLNNGTQGVGFYKLKSTGTIGANKAYLTYSGALAPEFLGFGETTSISEIEKMRNVENETFYDLQGRRVSQPTKGLYIVNGKKVVIK